MKKKLKPILLLAFLAVAGGTYAQTDTIRSTSGSGMSGATAKATNKDLAGSLAGASDFSTLQAALTASGEGS